MAVISGRSWRNNRSHSYQQAYRRRRKLVLRSAVSDARLEERCLLAPAGPPYNLPDSTQGLTKLGDVMFDGVPTDQSKTVTITNNSDKTIYPFLEGENSRTDFYPGTATFDPYDPVNQEFRGYIGYVDNTDAQHPNKAGLPAHSKITVTVPLAFWDSGRLIVSADGADQFSTYTKTLTPTANTTSDLTGAPDGAPFNFVTTESTASFLASIGGSDNKVLTFAKSFNSFANNKPTDVNWRSPFQNQLQTNQPLIPNGQTLLVTGPGLPAAGMIVTANSSVPLSVTLPTAGITQKIPVQQYNFQAVKFNTTTNLYEVVNLPSLAPQQVVQPGVPLVLNTQTTPTATTNGLVLWYHDVRSLAPNNDAPFQLTEFTFRGTYYDKKLSPGTGFDWLMNDNDTTDDKGVYAGVIHNSDDYDISFVDTINMPIAMEATGVSVSNTSPAQTADFGWVGSSQSNQDFQTALKNFGSTNPNTTTNTNGLGQYFGGKGWPAYLTLQDQNIKMPAGQNVFLAAPSVDGGTADIFLNVNFPNPPNPPNIPSIHAPLFALNDSAIAGPINGPGKFDIGGNDHSFAIGGDPTHKITPGTPNLGLRTGTDDIKNLNTYVKDHPGWWDVTYTSVNTHKDVDLGLVKSLWTVSGALQGVVMNNNLPTGASQPTTADVFVFHLVQPAGSPNLRLRTNPADLYLINNYVKDHPSWWSITYGANFQKFDLGAVKSLWTVNGQILGVVLNKAVPAGVTTTGVATFTLSQPDYATQRIAGLWYSWAKFYADNVVSTPTPSGQSVPGTIANGNILTLGQATPGLVPGMVVTGKNTSGKDALPAGCVILSISADNKTIHLSETATGVPVSFSFAKPSYSTIVGYNSSYPQLVNFTFANTAQKTAALAFGETVFAVMAGWSVSIKPNTPSPWNPLLVNIIGGNLSTDYIQYGNTDIRTMLTNLSKSALRGVPDFTSPLYSNPATWYPDPSVATLGLKFNAYNLDPFVWFVHDKLGLTAYAFSLDDDIGNVEAGGSTNIDVAVGGLAGLNNKSPYSNTAQYGVVTTTATAIKPKASRLTDVSNKLIFGQIGLYSSEKHAVGALVNGPGVHQGATVQLFSAGDGTIDLTRGVTTADKNTPYAFFGQLVYTATVLGQGQDPHTLILTDKDAYDSLKKLGDATTIQNITVTGEFIDPKGDPITSITQTNGVTTVTLKDPLVPNGYAQKGTYYAYTFGAPFEPLLRDGGYEYRYVGGGHGTDNYLNGSQLGDPKTAAQRDDWTFFDSTTNTKFLAGIALAPGSLYAGPQQIAPQGLQVGFLQGDSKMIQPVILAKGWYALSLDAAQSSKNSAGNQTFLVIVDGVAKKTITPGTTAFTPTTNITFQVGAGTHWITLLGVNKNASAVLVDKVLIVPTSPPTHRPPKARLAPAPSPGTAASGNGATATSGPTATTGAPLASGFGAAIDAFVTTLFQEDLGTVPDPSTLKTWSGRLAAGVSPNAVALSIWSSPEHRMLVNQGVVPPISFARSYADALLAARRAGRGQGPIPTGPMS